MKNNFQFKYLFPNFITLINLFLGCMAIVIAFRGENEYNAAWLIIAAAIFDLFDGLVARALDARSEFGAQLDSLADMVSFCIAPAVILFNWFTLVLTRLSAQSTFELVTAESWQNIVLFSAFLFALAGAARLARFNAQEANQKGFNGMPTPAAAIMVASLWLLIGHTDNESLRLILLNLYTALGVLLILSVLMVSNLRMLSFKISSLSVQNNLFQYILLFLSVVLIVFFEIGGVALSIVVYIVLSVMNSLVKNNN